MPNHFWKELMWAQLALHAGAIECARDSLRHCMAEANRANHPQLKACLLRALAALARA